MAIFHVDTYPITRDSEIGSAVAAAAYRAGTILRQRSTLTGDARTIKRQRKAGADRSPLHDYSQRFGVVSTDLIFPSADSLYPLPDRESIWNQAEDSNRRKNSRMAREFRIALPHELAPKHRRDLALDIAKQLVDRYEFVADVAIHRPSHSGDQRNHHAHIMTTTNKWLNGALCRKTDLELSNRQCADRNLPFPRVQILEIRQLIEKITNEHLVAAGLNIRVDCRSLRAQGVPIRPVKSICIAKHYVESRDAANDNKLDQSYLISEEQVQINIEFLKGNSNWLIDRCRNNNGVLNEDWLAASLQRYVPERHGQFEVLLQWHSSNDGNHHQLRPAPRVAEQKFIAVNSATNTSLESEIIQKQSPDAPQFDEPSILKMAEGFICKLHSLPYMFLHELRTDPQSLTEEFWMEEIREFAEYLDPDQLSKQRAIMSRLEQALSTLTKIQSSAVSQEMRRLTKAVKAVVIVIEEALKICPDILPDYKDGESVEASCKTQCNIGPQKRSHNVIVAE